MCLFPLGRSHKEQQKPAGAGSLRGQLGRSPIRAPEKGSRTGWAS